MDWSILITNIVKTKTFLIESDLNIDDLKEKFYIQYIEYSQEDWKIMSIKHIKPNLYYVKIKQWHKRSYKQSGIIV